MKSKIYQKKQSVNIKKLLKFIGLGIAISAALIGLYVFFPIISWELYVKPALANSSYASPIPQNTIQTKNYLKSLVINAQESISTINYNNSTKWLPQPTQDNSTDSSLSFYSISIPSIDLENAMVSTIDLDLESHLVHFPGTAYPTAKGTSVIFGHSTLPQLYNRQDYKTIFAKIHDVKIGNEIYATVENNLYKYKIFDIEIVEAENTSYLTQNYDASYLYIVTCTPPGTTWKRLVVKARLE